MERMSISNEEWNAGRTWETLEARILIFLKQSKKPFDITEIMNGLGYNIQVKDFWSLIGGVASYWSVQKALDNLVREGTVKAKIIKQQIGEQTYYKAT